jgi:hypothetical protein
MISEAGEAWVKHGKGGKLLGTFPLLGYQNEAAVGEVYFINDLNLVGLRFPDNSRMAVGKSWLSFRDATTIAAYDRELAAYKRANGIRDKIRFKTPPKLKLKSRLSKASRELQARLEKQAEAQKPKLAFKTKPKLKLRKK